MHYNVADNVCRVVGLVQLDCSAILPYRVSSVCAPCRGCIVSVRQLFPIGRLLNGAGCA